MRTLERALLLLAAIYLVVFAWRQCPGLFDARILEWDARASTLPAFRYHGSNLFQNDLLVDAVSAQNPPLWRLCFWLGTLFTDPFTVSKLLPFVGLALVVWHGFFAGRRIGGLAMGAATVILLVHCTTIWNRMVGANPRGFGFPLMVAFLRYALDGADRRALVVLVLAMAAYPPVFVVAAGAWVLLLAFRRAPRRAWLELGLALIASLAIVGFMRAVTDPRLGGPPTRAQAATLAQMQPGSIQPYYPPPPPLRSITNALLDTAPSTHDLLPTARFSHAHGELAMWLLVVGLALLALRRHRSPSKPLLAVLLSSLIAFALAELVLYRLYLPDRMLTYSWPVLLAFALPLLATRAFPSEKAPLAALGLLAFVLVATGDGLVRSENLTYFGEHLTPIVGACASLPVDATIATQPERATYVQSWAHRRVPFSSTTNFQFFYDYAKTMEQRIGDFYRAYYGRSLDDVRAYTRNAHVDYLIVDERDFGPQARARAEYYEPWRTLANRLLDENPPGTQALAQLPPASIVFRDGTRLLVDASKL